METKVDSQRFEDLRKSAGFRNQDELARAIGISRSRLSDWEQGKRPPSSKYIRPWAKALKISEGELLELLGL